MKMAANNSAFIASYVFMDLETTGIPSHEHNKTSITELSLVAVKREHLLTCRAGATPRVQHKLTLCFNPRRLINPEATRTTGLCNDLLEYETIFDDNVFETLDRFLKTLEKPVCLLAHNGILFDYPILKASLAKIERKLPEDLLCADTLHAFNDILSGRPEETSQSESTDETDLATPGNDQNEVDFRSLNESTPKKRKTDIVPARLRKALLTSEKRQKNAKRRLCYSEMKGKNLASVYEKLVGRRAVGCHRAEVDCLLSLEAVGVVPGRFVSWVDGNHCIFNDIEPMRVGVPLK